MLYIFETVMAVFNCVWLKIMLFNLSVQDVDAVFIP